jgi:sucrose-6-phosphate hydrolase SacC (GH32 family)
VITLKKHVGVILSPSKSSDLGGSSFSCLFKEADAQEYYLYYSGATDQNWTKATIQVAKSADGLRFEKQKGDPLISTGKETVTPAVFKADGNYWMVFAFRPENRPGRRIGIASADNPLGPWEFVRTLIEPEGWESESIDIGPSIVNISGNEKLVFYSNVTSGRFLGLGPRRPIYRRIGILRLKVSGSRSVEVKRWDKNPLTHLNGDKGSWNESLFCPGYFSLKGKSYLLPSGSTYSLGFPYKQYVGLIEGGSPFFEDSTAKSILISGPEEKTRIIPTIKGEIALDTASPIIKEGDLWMYYAVMDRADGIWKTALSIFSID